MIVQCPTCRALTSIEAAELLAEGEGVGLRCRECDAVTRLPFVDAAAMGGERPKPTLVPPPAAVPVVTPLATAPAPAAPAASPTSPLAPATDATPPVTSSPAASSAAASADAAAIRAAIEAVPASDDDGPIVEEMLKLVPAWTDADAHTRLIKRAALEDRLAPLGTRYRAVLEKRPDDPIAKRAQEEILSQAMVRMKLAPAGKSELEQGKVVGKIAMGLVALLMGAAIWFMVISMRSL